MSYVYAEITIIALTILQICAPIPTNNTTDKNGKPQSTLQANGSTPSFLGHRLVKRCWNSVIAGRPTLAKVIIAGSFFIVTALGLGLYLFFHIYCRHKEEFAEIEQELLTGKRCFKPQLEDLETGLLSVHITKPVSFRKTGLLSKFRRRKELDDDKSEEDDDSEGDDEEEDESGDVQNEDETVEKSKTWSLGGMFKTPARKKAEQMRESEDPEDERHQAHGEDQRKTHKGKGMSQGKPKGKELQKKGKREKGESSETSDTKKKHKKPWESLVSKKKADKKKKEASEKPKDKKKKDKKAKKGKKSNFKALKEKLKKKKQVKKVKKPKKIKFPKLKKIKIKKRKKK